MLFNLDTEKVCPKCGCQLFEKKILYMYPKDANLFDSNINPIATFISIRCSRCGEEVARIKD